MKERTRTLILISICILGPVLVYLLRPMPTCEQKNDYVAAVPPDDIEKLTSVCPACKFEAFGGHYMEYSYDDRCLHCKCIRCGYHWIVTSARYHSSAPDDRPAKRK